jgi:serine protease Do
MVLVRSGGAVVKGFNRRPLLIVSLLAVAAISLASGCIFPEEWFTPPETETPPAAEPVTPAPTPTPIDPNLVAPAPCTDGEPLPDFVAVVEKVKPSVVAIETDIAAGSGWIWGEGIIVTNNHVVNDARTIVVTLDGGRTFTATEVRTDPDTDLAVLKIDAADLVPAVIGDCGTLKVGQPVAAIGNALGLGIRMTGGWISRLGVSIPVSQGQTLDDLIETDAAINPGNSGGPLVNMAGEVIGITSVKVSQVGVEGLGYAISMTTAGDIIYQLIRQGYVVRAYLGVGLADVSPMLALLNDYPVDRGALVNTVAPGGPADKAGIQKGDIIVRFEGQEITGAGQLIQAIHERAIGETVDIVYWRGSESRTTQATLTENSPLTPGGL